MGEGVAGSAARELAAEVLRRLTEAGQTLATAESLTGGLVAAALTDVPGASSAFRGGVVAYAADLKAAVLGVPDDLLERRGAVDAAVAEYLATPKPTTDAMFDHLFAELPARLHEQRLVARKYGSKSSGH